MRAIKKEDIEITYDWRCPVCGKPNSENLDTDHGIEILDCVYCGSEIEIEE